MNIMQQVVEAAPCLAPLRPLLGVAHAAPQREQRQDGMIPRWPRVHGVHVSGIFLAHHLTSNSENAHGIWLAEVWHPGMRARVVASAPPFNGRFANYPRNVEKFNKVCFGSRLSVSMMEIFSHPDIVQVAQDAGITIRGFEINDVIQKRMSRVMELVHELRTPRANLANSDIDATYRLEAFVNWISGLRNADVQSLQHWQQLLRERFGDRYEQRAQQDSTLSLFGFSQQASDYCSSTRRNRHSNWQQYALRWLDKALGTYGLCGSQADVCNYICAAMGQQAPDRSELTLTQQAVTDFNRLLVSDSLPPDLWVPSHLVHDAEFDDALLYVLLKFLRIHLRQPPLQVLVQLPADRSIQPLREALESGAEHTQVFVDPRAANQDALKHFWDLD